MKPLQLPGPIPAEGESFIPFARRPDYKIDPWTGCWNWAKGIHVNGYPMGTNYGKPHRVYYQLKCGPIAKGVHVHHMCRNPRCVNPDHLQAVDTDAHFKHHFLDENGLSVEAVAEIRRLGTIPGVSARDVAEQFGISNWSVYRYWKGRRWQDDVGDQEAAPEPWPCVACGGPTVGHRHKQYCSPQCKAREAGRRARARAKAAA